MTISSTRPQNDTPGRALRSPRSHHPKGTSNYLAIFGDDYLELLGGEPRNAGLRWGHRAGLAGLVFRTADADQTWRQLRQRDVPLDDARLRTLRIAADRIPNGRVFFREHFGVDADQVPQGIERAVGLTIKVESVGVAEQALAANAVTGGRRHGDKRVVTPDQANGVILAFA